MSKTIDLEFIGDPPIMDESTVMRIATGELSDRSANVLRMAEQHRIRAIPGVVRRVVDKESFDTSRDYIFGPSAESYVQAVDHADAHKILDSESGQQFRRCDSLDIIIPSVAEIAFSSVHEISPYDVTQRR